MIEPNKCKFLVDAVQTAYLWRNRGQYGTREAAIRALRKRRSAMGSQNLECEQAFDLGLSVVIETESAIKKRQGRVSLLEAEAKRVATEIAFAVRRSIPDCSAEMVEYAIRMLFWMPMMR